MALINFMDDPSQANALLVNVSVPTGVPESVRVKYVWMIFFIYWDLFFSKFLFFKRYLSATSVSDKENITWAGQVITSSSPFIDPNNSN